MKRKLAVRRTRYTVWGRTSNDACRSGLSLDVDMDEPADPDGLGGEVTDTVGTARVMAAPRTPTKTEREEHDVSHVLYRPLESVLCHGKGIGETPPDTEW